MTAPTAAPPRTGSRFRVNAGRPVIVGLVAAVIGFLLVGQLQGPRPETPSLEAESEGNLARILSDLNAEADALQNEIAELKVQLNDLRRFSRDEAAAEEAAAAQLRNLQVLAGTTPVSGPGLVMTVSDPNGLVTYDTLIDIVQELRDAGAEAVAVNDLRIGVSTAFAEREDRVTVDGFVVSPPYTIAAIGQPATLEGGLKIPGGAVDATSALKGVRVELSKQAKVVLPALAKPPAFDVARPVAKG